MKRLSYFILLALLMSLTSTPVFGQTKFQEGGIWYTTEDMPAGEVKVTYYGNDQSSVPDQYKYKDDIVIPSSITNYTVTKIGWGAFYECSGLTSITLPNSVTSIDGFAFQDCI